jgi:hypothetical protein
MRKIIAVLVALSTALVVLVATPNTAQAASKRQKVSIKVSARTITQYQYLTISGTAKPAAVKPVIIQQKMAGGKWKNLYTLTTSATGWYSTRNQVMTTKTRQYRVYVPKAGKYKAARSTVIQVTVRTAPKATSSVAITSTGPLSITAGESFVVNGTTSANLVGKVVQLQLQDGTGWSPIGSATVAGNATFSVTGPALQAGASKVVRVYAPGTASTYDSASAAVGFVVYGWYYLSELNTVEGGMGKGTATISGQYFPKSVSKDFYSGGSPTSGQYDLGRKCTTFAATVGWDDSSHSSSVGDASVYKDTVTAWTRTGIPLGTTVPMSIDITGALRLKVEARRTSATWVDSSMAFGDARIRCAF